MSAGMVDPPPQKLTSEPQIIPSSDIMLEEQ